MLEPDYRAELPIRNMSKHSQKKFESGAGDRPFRNAFKVGIEVTTSSMSRATALSGFKYKDQLLSLQRTREQEGRNEDNQTIIRKADFSKEQHRRRSTRKD